MDQWEAAISIDIKRDRQGGWKSVEETGAICHGVLVSISDIFLCSNFGMDFNAEKIFLNLFFFRPTALNLLENYLRKINTCCHESVFIFIFTLSFDQQVEKGLGKL